MDDIKHIQNYEESVENCIHSKHVEEAETSSSALYSETAEDITNQNANEVSPPQSDAPGRNLHSHDDDAIFENNVWIGGVLRAKRIVHPWGCLFRTTDNLEDELPHPYPGMWAMVGSTYPFDIYRCRVEGAWELIDKRSVVLQISDYLSKCQFATEQWVQQQLSAIDTLDEEALGQYLNAHNFATKNWVEQNFAKLGESIGSIDLSLYLPKSDFNSMFERVVREDGTWFIKAKATLVSVGGIASLYNDGSIDDPSFVTVTMLEKYVTTDQLKEALKNIGPSGIDVTQLQQYLQQNNYITTSALSGYATEAWVEGKKYLTEHQDLSGYATEAWVEGKKYLTEHQDLSDYVKNIQLADYVKSDLFTSKLALKLDKSEYDKIWEVVKDDAGNILYILSKYSVVSKGGVAALNQGDSVPGGGGTGGGLDLAALEAYLLQHGYATQAWVQARGYLTSISKAMVESVLTGNITTHTHSQYLTQHQSLANYVTLNTAQTINADKRISKRLLHNGVSTSWVTGRDQAFLVADSLVGYSPFASIKTDAGSWDIGAYGTYPDSLIFSFISDANYTAGNNSTTAQIFFNKTGYIKAAAFQKFGGTSSQFLKADGSVDTNSYALASSLGNYYTKTEADGRYVTSLDVSGNYVRYIINGTAHNITVPYATYAATVRGTYTGNGGKRNPNAFGLNRVGFFMSDETVNGNSQYKDWILMDCYGGGDVGGAVAIGVNRQSLGAYIMRSEAARTTWAASAELIGTHNYASILDTRYYTKNEVASAYARGGAAFYGSSDGTGARWIRIATLSSYVASGIITIINGYNYNVNAGLIFTFSSGYRGIGGYSITQIGGTGATFTKARIVYPTASDDPIYIEVYYIENASGHNSINVRLTNSINTTLIYTSTPGTIPSGYASYEQEFTGPGLAARNLLVGAIAGVSTIAFAGGGTLKFDAASGTFRFSHSIVSDGGVAALNQGDSTSGGGGSGSGGLDLAALEAYLLQHGYATQAWVQARGYLTSISKAMVESVLTGNITSHTHSQYVLASALGNYVTLNGNEPITGAKTFNLGAWALKGDEHNDITARWMNAYTWGNGSNISAIRHGLDFQWYDSHWVIGSIRGGSTDSAGFGIGELNSDGKLNPALQVTATATYINNFEALHKGNYTSILDGRYALASALSGYVTALGTSGNYLTWTKNGITNYIVVPSATNLSDVALECFVYGDNATGTHDLSTALSDTARKSGFYRANNDGNAPLFIHCSHSINTYAFQIGTTYSDSSLKFRHLINNTWGSWRNLLDTANYASVLDTRYLRSFFTANPGYDCNTHSEYPLASFTYSNNAPFTGGFVDISVKGYGFMLGTTYGSDGALYFRRHGVNTDGGMGKWQQLARITDNVASATNADKLDGYHASDFLLRSGGSMTNTNTVVNLNADLLDGHHNGDVTAKAFGAQYIAAVGGTVAAAKANMLNAIKGYVFGNVITVGANAVDNWANDSATVVASSAYSAINVTPQYDGDSNGQFLLFHLGSYNPKLVGRYYGAWTAMKTFAFLDDNVASATKLATARTINGTSFNGTANITTANWGTARNISISDSAGTNTGTAVSVNGSAAVTLKLPATIAATLSGNASSATKLADNTAVKAWGQTFFENGKPKSISGNLTSVGSINTYLSAIWGSGNARLNIAGTAADTDFIHLYVDGGGNGSRPLVLQNGYGNVGIGTPTPAYKLDVNGNARFATTVNIGDACKLGHIGNRLELMSGGNEMVVSGSATSLYVNYRGSGYTGVIPTAWIFNAGSPTTYADFQLGNIRSYGALETSGNITSHGDIVADGGVAALSDRRVKSDIRDLTFRAPLQPRSYIKDGRRQIGFIAQEVAVNYPELVNQGMTPEELWTLNYMQLTAVLAAQSNSHEDEIRRLKRRVSELESRLSAYTH